MAAARLLEAAETILDVAAAFVLLPVMLTFRLGDAAMDVVEWAGEMRADVRRVGWRPVVGELWAAAAWRVDSWVTRW